MPWSSWLSLVVLLQSQLKFLLVPYVGIAGEEIVVFMVDSVVSSNRRRFIKSSLFSPQIMQRLAFKPRNHLLAHQEPKNNRDHIALGRGFDKLEPPTSLALAPRPKTTTFRPLARTYQPPLILRLYACLTKNLPAGQGKRESLSTYNDGFFSPKPYARSL